MALVGVAAPAGTSATCQEARNPSLTVAPLFVARDLNNCDSLQLSHVITLMKPFEGCANSNQTSPRHVRLPHSPTVPRTCDRLANACTLERFSSAGELFFDSKHARKRAMLPQSMYVRHVCVCVRVCVLMYVCNVSVRSSQFGVFFSLTVCSRRAGRSSSSFSRPAERDRVSG